MFRRLNELILTVRWPLSLAVAVVTLLTGYLLTTLKIDPSIETLFDKTSLEYRHYSEFTTRYGSDQMIVIAMETEDFFEMAPLKKLRALTRQIEKMESVERVLSLANVMDIKHKFMGVKVVPALKDVWSGDKTPEEIRGDVLANELFRHNLVSADGKIANLIVYLKPARKRTGGAGGVIENLRLILAGYEQQGLTFYMAGAPVEHYEFIRLIRRDQFTFVPLIILILIATILFIYRSLACMVLSMSIVLVTLIWSMGTIALFKQQLNLVTSLLAPVIMIVTIANSIHIMNLFFDVRSQHASLRKSVCITMDQLGVPNFLAHATTVLGFASLAVNPVPAIQSFGIFAAIGTFYSFVVIGLLTPLLLPILPYRPTREHYDESHFFNRFLIRFLEKFEFHWKWLILFVTAVIVAVSVWGVSKLQVDTNLIRQMKPDSRLAQATRFIDEHVTGVYALGFILRRKDGGDFIDSGVLMKIDRLKEYLEGRPEISNVNSLTTLIKKLNQAREDESDAYHIPEDSEMLGRYFKGMQESGDPQIWTLVSPDFQEMRLEARMKAVGTREGAAMEKAVRSYLEEEIAADFDYHLTGNVVLLGRMAEDLILNQLKGFGFAFLSILAVIAFVFRSLKMGLLAAVPNLLPILAVYGLMGHLPIELSSPTAMISSIVLGMVVDASIHFLYRFRLEFSHRQHYLQSLHHTYRHVGQALMVSTMILVAGFASSVFAGFRPTIHFGLLTSCTIFFALVCTLMILPVCLVILKPFGPPRLFRRESPSRYL